MLWFAASKPANGRRSPLRTSETQKYLISPFHSESPYDLRKILLSFIPRWISELFNFSSAIIILYLLNDYFNNFKWRYVRVYDCNVYSILNHCVYSLYMKSVVFISPLFSISSQVINIFNNELLRIPTKGTLKALTCTTTSAQRSPGGELFASLGLVKDSRNHDFLTSKLKYPRPSRALSVVQCSELRSEFQKEGGIQNDCTARHIKECKIWWRCHPFVQLSSALSPRIW